MKPQDKKPVTPQVAALPGMTPLGIKPKDLANTPCGQLLSDKAIAKRKAFAKKYGPTHGHVYTRSKPSATVETCPCGKFRHTENAGPSIVGIPVNNPTHTPGPWKVGTGWVYQDDGGKPGRKICADFPGMYRDDGTAEANARLIAAAPDMLAALKSAAFAWEQTGLSGDELPPYAAKVRAAIAKAEGK